MPLNQTNQTEFFEIELIIYIKMDLALNNLQRLICHKTKPTKLNVLNRTDYLHKIGFGVK